MSRAEGCGRPPRCWRRSPSALRLSDDERLYLFDLAQQRPGNRRRKVEADGPLAQLVLDLSPLPAMLTNHRNDILAWNPEMVGLLHVDFDELPDRHRNGIWLCLLHPAMRSFYLDREEVIREGIADLRAAWAAHPEDNELAELVEELRADSAEFDDLWAQRDVQLRGRGHKRLLHPVAGPLTIQFEVLSALQVPDQRLVIYRAADEDSQSALDVIVSSL